MLHKYGHTHIYINLVQNITQFDFEYRVYGYLSVCFMRKLKT